MPIRDTAVVIPVYNEETVIGSVISDVSKMFELVVCIDDGSSDGSARVISASDANLVQHPINLGQGAALQTGIDYALLDPDIEYIVTYDADGQHRLEDALDMLDFIRAGDVDVVFGSRFLDDRTQLTASKRLALGLAVRYMNATSGVHLSDAHNGLRVFNRKFAESLEITQNGMAHASEIVGAVHRGGFRYAERPVQILYTDYSKSKGQSLLNSVNILFDLLFGNRG